MTHCPACGTEITGAGRFCSACGAPVRTSSAIPTEKARAVCPPAAGQDPAPSEDPTRTSARRRRAPAASAGGSDGRFAPGVILAGRYRIVGLLGKGGMGEVYRADDLTLGLPVALKFLPEEVAGDQERMRRLVDEVRVARRITHPNVCRVHDIEEADGQRFIAMEHVDGEDLASLLRRIGRFPGERGAEIARQICAGLAAAHDVGILHRDLKPGNIMIDGRGRVRITDFGLAAAAGETSGAEIQAGTPAYMAPEQLDGREVTRRSDIYALGLVLYEIFTGRAAHRVTSREEALEAISSDPIPSPSSQVHELDRAVERVILRCLEPDPLQRPGSALAVGAALPGGDPLAAALAAGETPSPEMVAAAGEEGVLRARIAWLLMGAVLAGLMLGHFIRLDRTLLGWVPAPRAPEALADRGQALIASLGHDLDVGDQAWGWRADMGYLSWLEGRETKERWDPLRRSRPAAVRFWYRQSPGRFPQTIDWRVQPEDPALTEPGMARTELDSQGRLLGLEVVAPAYDDSPPGEARADWRPLFEAAEMDLTALTPAEPALHPPLASDERAAWEGEVPWLPGETIRIEAAGWRGVPVYFRVLMPWMNPRVEPAGARLLTFVVIFSVLTVGTLAVTGFLAVRNLRAGRADRRGALKLFVWVAVAHTLAWAGLGDHAMDFLEEWELIGRHVGSTLFLAGMVWLLYLGLEPFVRRRSPETLISWNRITAGRLRDPRIGRDLLVGLAVASVWPLIHFAGIRAGAMLWDRPLLRPFVPTWEALLGARKVFGMIVDVAVHSAVIVMVLAFVIAMLRVILRRDALAGPVFALSLGAVFSLAGEQPMVRMPVIALTLALVYYLAVRYGLVALWAAVFYDNQVRLGLVAADLSSWVGSVEIFISLVVAAIALWAFRTALGGRPALGAAASG